MEASDSSNLHEILVNKNPNPNQELSDLNSSANSNLHETIVNRNPNL